MLVTKNQGDGRGKPRPSFARRFICIQIPISALVSFVEALEVGYSKHKNPYHNLMHAADVTQTVHYLLLKTGMVVSCSRGYLQETRCTHRGRSVQICPGLNAASVN